MIDDILGVERTVKFDSTAKPRVYKDFKGTKCLHNRNVRIIEEGNL